MPWVKVSLSVYGSSDLRSPWNANRNVAAAAGSVNDAAASAAANSAALNFIVVLSSSGRPDGPAAGSWRAKRRPISVGRFFRLSSRSNQLSANQVKHFSLLVEPVERDPVVGAPGSLSSLRYSPSECLPVRRDAAPILFLLRSCSRPRSPCRAGTCWIPTEFDRRASELGVAGERMIVTR